MKIWKNTNTLDNFDQGLVFTTLQEEAQIALIGSKKLDLTNFSCLKGIFRAGIGKDNVPEEEALARNIKVKYPSNETINTIYRETASFTCSLVFKMLYDDVGTIDPWTKKSRNQLCSKNLLIIGNGNIGKRVFKFLNPFMNVYTYDILQNSPDELIPMIQKADCITIHIPKTDNNNSFFNQKLLSHMKNGSALINTARGPLVEENALYEEISAGRIRAAFDVYWNEPYNGKLKDFHPDTFFMTPHIASTCKEFIKGCRDDIESFIAELSSK